jgi:glycosyltransferase involved in cell wall biosynthesis
MDMYPWLAGTAGVLSTDTALFRVLEKTAVSGLKGASAVVAIGRCMKERMISLGVAEESIHVVSNWANTEVVKPIPINKNKLRKKYELADKFVVMYSGNIGVSHYFDDLIEAAEILSEKKEIVFLFVGNGVRFEEVKTDVTKRRLKNFLFLDYQNYDDLAFSLSMGDVHFVSLREGFEGLVVPSKTYGILAAGRPVIYQGRKNGEIARLIEEQRVGTVVAQKNTARLVEAIEHAFVDEQWRKETGDRARAVAVEKYSSEQMIENYCNVLLR